MTGLYLLAPIEPREKEAWRRSSHVGVSAVLASSEAEARRSAADAFSEGADDAPWLDPQLSFCTPAESAGDGSGLYYAAAARMKGPKRPPEGAIPVDTDLVGPGAFTAAPALTPEERRRYIAESLDPERGLQEDVEPRVFLGQAADATILSYPKSGKTWIAYLVTNYIARLLGFRELFDKLTAGEGLSTFAPEARRGYLGAVAARRTPERWAPLVRFMHQDSLGYPYFAPKTLGAPGTDRHVILVRDPRDVLVSHYHHVVVKNRGVFDAHRDKPTIAPDTEISEFIRSDFLGIRHLLAYYAGWSRWAAANDAAITYYEDFIDAPEDALADLLRAIGVGDVRPDIVAEAVAASAFDRLSAAESDAKRAEGRSDEASSRRMRRGKAGGYVDEISAEDAAFLTRVMARADIPVLKRYLAS